MIVFIFHASVHTKCTVLYRKCSRVTHVCNIDTQNNYGMVIELYIGMNTTRSIKDQNYSSLTFSVDSYIFVHISR